MSNSCLLPLLESKTDFSSSAILLIFSDMLRQAWFCKEYYGRANTSEWVIKSWCELYNKEAKISSPLIWNGGIIKKEIISYES